jgi:glycosyltransferase involved in cell wall biosynthesis
MIYRMFCHWDFYRYVIRRAKKRYPDILYARNDLFAFPYILLKRKLRIPLYLEVDTVLNTHDPTRGGTFFCWLAGKIEKWQFQSADEILPASETARSRLLEFGVHPGKIGGILNPADGGENNYQSIARQTLGYDPDQYRRIEENLDKGLKEVELVTSRRVAENPEKYTINHPSHSFRTLDPSEGIINIRSVPFNNMIPWDGMNKIPANYIEDPDCPSTYVELEVYRARLTGKDRAGYGVAGNHGSGVRGSEKRIIFARRLNRLYAEHACHEDSINAPVPENRSIRIMRIISIITQGGVAKVCLQSMLRVPEQDVEQIILVFGEKVDTIEQLAEKRPDIRLINVPLNLWPGSFNRSVFKSVHRLADIIQSVKPDIIHLHEPQFSPAVRIAAAQAGSSRVAVHLHNDYTQRKGSIKNQLEQITLQSLREAHLIACSQTIHDAARVWLGPARYPIAMIEDGTDDITAACDDKLLVHCLTKAADGRKIVAKMAHIAPHKRIEDFFMACRILLDEEYPVFVLFMGYGQEWYKNRLTEQFHDMFEPHEGEFLYRVQSVQPLMKHIHIGVSTSELEGLGLNVLEYQVEGVPVVCTDLKPHREMVEDDVNGLLYPVGNIPALVRRLRNLLDNEDTRERLARAGRATACARGWKETGRRTVEFYRTVMDRKIPS